MTIIQKKNWTSGALTRSFTMLNTMMENENTSFVQCSQERDRNITKACAFSFSISIQHDEASRYTFDINIFNLLSRSSCSPMFCKIAEKACNFIKWRLQHRRFPVNMAEFLRTVFLEHRWLLLWSKGLQSWTCIVFKSFFPIARSYGVMKSI